jgi:hypothetical protein
VRITDGPLAADPLGAGTLGPVLKDFVFLRAYFSTRFRYVRGIW